MTNILTEEEKHNIYHTVGLAPSKERDALIQLAAQKAVEPYQVEIDMLKNALKQLEETSDAKIKVLGSCGSKLADRVVELEEQLEKRDEVWKKAILVNGQTSHTFGDILVLDIAKLKEAGIKVK